MKKTSLLFLALLLASSTSSFAADKVKIKNAWVSEAPPMAKALAGYLEIHNKTDKSVMLRSISSPDFERSELHKTEIHEGMARMTPVSSLMIKANSKIIFEPGGLHLMLINPRKTVKAGDKLEMTLHLTNDTKLTFKATVKKMSSMHEHSGHEMQHDMKMDESHDNHDMHENREDMKHDHKPHKH